MSAGLPRAVGLADRGEAGDDRIALDYDGRFLRRRRLQSVGGRDFLADLPETVSLSDGMAFVLEDGSRIVIEAAPEPLFVVRGAALVRLAWHIGNRHTPCQIAEDRLFIRRDPVLARMLEGLGAELQEIDAPFTPEGGAYGHGRTLGHDHSHDHHDHAGG